MNSKNKHSKLYLDVQDLYIIILYKIINKIKLKWVNIKINLWILEIYMPQVKMNLYKKINF